MVKFSKIDKQLKKELKKVQRNAAKKLQLKSRDWAYFNKVGDYLVSYMIDIDFQRGRFRVRGDVVEIFPASRDEHAFRVEFFEWYLEVHRNRHRT